MSDLASESAVGLVHDGEGVGYEGFLPPPKLTVEERRQRLPQLLEDRLHSQRPPNIPIQFEKPEHRVILILKLKGFSNHEIARELGYTDAWISQITRQPWFQSMLIDKMAEAGDRVLDELLALEGKNSLFTLIELRDCAESESVRKDCAIRILDQCVGKPIQRNENLNFNVTRAERAMNQSDEIDAKLEELERQMKALHADGG